MYEFLALQARLGQLQVMAKLHRNMQEYEDWKAERKRQDREIAEQIDAIERANYGRDAIEVEARVVPDNHLRLK